MSRSTNAVLLSALVLPGAGQIYLKRYRRGIALIANSLACLWVFVDSAMQQAAAVLQNLESGGGALDVGQLSDLANQTASGSGSTVATVATFVLVGCWLVGIIDAYRLGKNENLKGPGAKRFQD
jgi:hypothetical protein